MAVRKTQKKHLGKKRKSLSKRKAHSKKKRHSKQRITKKRYHKGGSDESTVGDGSTVGYGSTVNPLLLLAADANEIAENIKADDQAKAEKKAKEDAAKKAKEWQNRLENYIFDKYPEEKTARVMYSAPHPRSIQTRLMNCIVGEKQSGWGRLYVDSSTDVDNSLYIDEKWIKKVVDFIEKDIIRRIKNAPSYNNDFKADQLTCINELLNEINTVLEKDYIFNLKYTYINKCPDKELRNRIIECIDKKNEYEDEVKIEDNFHYNNNNKKIKTFVESLITKIENDEKDNYVPNEELKNKLIDCVRYATQERQSDDPRIAGLPGRGP